MIATGAPADIETSSQGYATRFAGPVGAWLLARQARLVRALLRDLPPGASILDVGGGHAQLAGPLIEAGFAVTVLGSTPACAERLTPWLAGGRLRFDAGDTLNPPYPAGSFDAVVSVRLLPHCDEWQTLIAALCRAARLGVVVDYPTTRSLNRFAGGLFDTKRRLEGNTRTWRSFTEADIRGAFAAAGWRVQRRAPQFFLPMVLHRKLGARPLSAAAEGVCRALGLNALWGSPVLVRANPATPPAP